MIPYNAVPGAVLNGVPLRASDTGATTEFRRRLRAAGLAVTTRNSLGGDIDAACGLLARREAKTTTKTQVSPR